MSVPEHVSDDDSITRRTPRHLRLLDRRAGERLRARIPAEMKRGRIEAALPVGDLFVAILLGALILRPWQTALAYCLVAVPVIGMIEGYTGAAIGGRESLRSVARLGLAAIVCEWVAFMVTSQMGRDLPALRSTLLLAASLAAWVLARWALARFEARRPQRVVVIGSGYVTKRLMEVIGNHTRGRLEVLGYIDRPYTGKAHSDLHHLGDIPDLATIVRDNDVDRVIVAFTAHHTDQDLLVVLRECDQLGVQFDVVPRLFEYIGTSNHSFTLGSLPLLSVRGRDRRLLARIAKRAMDIAASGVALVLLSPVFGLITLLIKLEDRQTVFFRQERIGRHGRPFRVFKFRSMTLDADRQDGDKIEALLEGTTTIADAVETIKQVSDPRITRVGAFLRRTSLDELPQLMNVLRGDMSLVGPRPLRPFEVDALNDWELTRQLERPGITGLWQVTGRSATSWDERMQLDYSYVRHWTLSEDIEILARTVPSVITRDGAW